MSIVVVGAGAFGTALAIVIAYHYFIDREDS